MGFEAYPSTVAIGGGRMHPGVRTMWGTHRPTILGVLSVTADSRALARRPADPALVALGSVDVRFGGFEAASDPRSPHVSVIDV